MSNSDDYQIPEDWNPARALARMEEEKAVMGEDEPTMAQRILKESLPVVALSIVDIATNADNEKLRFDAGKYVIDRAFGTASPTGGDYSERKENPIERFLAGVVGDFEAS